MTETLKLKTEVDSICKKAGIDPKDVVGIHMTPDAIAFALQEHPKRHGVQETRARAFRYQYAEDD